MPDPISRTALKLSVPVAWTAAGCMANMSNSNFVRGDCVENEIAQAGSNNYTRVCCAGRVKRTFIHDGAGDKTRPFPLQVQNRHGARRPFQLGLQFALRRTAGTRRCDTIRFRERHRQALPDPLGARTELVLTTLLFRNSCL